MDDYPEAENKNRRHPHQTHKITQSHQADYSGPGEEDKIGPQDTGDSTTGPYIGHPRVNAHRDLSSAGSQATKEVEESEAEMTHGVLDVVAEDPKVEHIADDMKPSTVHEEGGEKGQRDPQTEVMSHIVGDNGCRLHESL